MHGEHARRAETRAVEVGAAGARAGLSEGIDGKTAVVYRRKATAGAKLVEVAVELGMKDQTLSRWLGEKRAAKRFERVEVVAAPAGLLATPILVHGPRGLRVEGL